MFNWFEYIAIILLNWELESHSDDFHKYSNSNTTISRATSDFRNNKMFSEIKVINVSSKIINVFKGLHHVLKERTLVYICTQYI